MDQIRTLMNKFAADLEATVRRTVLETVTSALGASSSNDPAVDWRPRVKAVTGQKRDPKVLAALVETVATTITGDPPCSIEQLGRVLKRPTKDLTLPIQKLLAAKRIRKEGNKRATRYYPVTQAKKK